VVIEAAAARLSSVAIYRVDNQEFHSPSQEWVDQTLAPMPGHEDYERRRREFKAPSGVDPAYREYFMWPLLSREQEHHLFRKMNYLKYIFDRNRDEVLHGKSSPARKAALVADAEESLREAGAVAKLIATANMRLVINIAKKQRYHCWNEFNDIVSEGSLTLLTAVSHFDYSFGTKFSTYAHWAIMRRYFNPTWRMRGNDSGTSIEDYGDDGEGSAPRQVAADEDARSARDSAWLLLEYLEPRERQVARMKIGFGGPLEVEKTLQEIGQAIGVSKERVRQLYVRIQRKLRSIARRLGLEYGAP
jgi:RNA polymerase primary sigma factor